MRIKRIDIFHLDLPILGEPYEMAGAKLSSVESTILRLTLENGTTGWGETCPLGPTYQEAHALGARAAIAAIAPHVIGADVTCPNRLGKLMESVLRGHNYAKAAFDIAAYDATGKLASRPVAELLGGRHRSKVPSYVVIKGAKQAAVLEQVKQLQNEGWTRFQYKAGIMPLVSDIANIRALFAQSPEIFPLKLDANRGMTTRDAITLSRGLADIPVILEQPVETIEDMATIRPLLAHPLYFDEVTNSINDVLSILGRGLGDGFGVKITRFGGLTNAATVRDICAAQNVPHTCDDSFGTDIIAAACAHLGATVRTDLLDGVWVATPYLKDPLDPARPYDPAGGEITISTAPGLGVSPNVERLGPAIATYE